MYKERRFRTSVVVEHELRNFLTYSRQMATEVREYEIRERLMGTISGYSLVQTKSEGTLMACPTTGCAFEVFQRKKMPKVCNEAESRRMFASSKGTKPPRH